MFSNYKLAFFAFALALGTNLFAAPSANGETEQNEPPVRARVEEEPGRITGECVWLGTCHTAARLPG